jgi:phage gp29-like protein
VFDTGEAEDIKTFSEALPELVGVGMKIPVSWAHEKLRIPEPDDGEEVLTVASPANVLTPEMRPEPGRQTPAPASLARAALAAPNLLAAADEADAADEAGQMAINALLAGLPAADIEAAMQALLAPAIAALQAGQTPDEAGDALLEAFPRLDSQALEELLARAIFVADIWGRLSAERA